jgi:hypothetical protein
MQPLSHAGKTLLGHNCKKNGQERDELKKRGQHPATPTSRIDTDQAINNTKTCQPMELTPIHSIHDNKQQQESAAQPFPNNIGQAKPQKGAQPTGVRTSPHRRPLG